MPSRIIIPLVDKVRTRNLLKQDYDPIIMVKQGRNWLNLENYKTNPDPTPLTLLIQLWQIRYFYILADVVSLKFSSLLSI